MIEQLCQEIRAIEERISKNHSLYLATALRTSIAIAKLKQSQQP